MNKILICEKRFFYNDNQQLVLEERIGSDSELMYRESREYDDKNRVIRVDINDKLTSPNFTKTKEYYYGEPNNDKTYSIVESTETDENGITNVVNRMIEVDYDIDSLIERMTINGDVYKLKTYDVNNNLIYEREVNEDIINDYYFIYNHQNKIIKKIFNDMIFQETDYDKIGRIVRTINRDIDTNIITITNYKYDEQNRILEKIVEIDNDKKKLRYKYYKSTEIISYYRIDDAGNEVHQYDDVSMRQDDTKRIYITPTSRVEEEYDSNNNITKVLEYKIVE